jgi:hypothetical protein
MGNLAASAVTIEEIWSEGGLSGKRTTCQKVKLVLTGQGTGTNKILATVLGLTKIDSASPFAADGDDHIYVASPSYDGSYLQLKASATDALADITDTVRGIVRGT